MKFIVIVIIIIIGLAAVFFLFRGQDLGIQELNVQFFAPSRITLGGQVEYQVAYENITELALHDVEFTIVYPEGSLALDEELDSLKAISSETQTIANIGPKERGEVIFKSFFFGAVGESKEAALNIAYKTENSNATSRIKKTVSIETGSVPLALNLSFPSKINLGEEFEFSLTYISTSPNIFPGMQLKLVLPKTFQFLSASPPSSSGDVIWELGDMSSQDSGEIKIKGIISGEVEEERLFRAELGRYDEGTFTSYASREKQITVSLPSFEIIQQIKGSKANAVNPGEKLEWKIAYKNQSGEIIEGLEILVFFEGEAFDYSSLVSQNGAFSKSQKLLRWDQAAIPDFTLLEPGEEGILEFSMSVKSAFPIKEFKDKNFTVRSRAVAKVRGVTFAEDLQELKINSKFEFYQRGFRDAGPFDNSGPIPPQVGQKSTYTISWQVLNSSNDLSNVVIRGAFPSRVSWEGAVVPDGENLTFNSNTGEIVWNIGNLEHAVGFLLPIRQVSFQVGVTPREEDIGGALELIGLSNAVARDTFTGTQLEDFSSAIDTTLPDDPSVSEIEGVVAGN